MTPGIGRTTGWPDIRRTKGTGRTKVTTHPDDTAERSLVAEGFDLVAGLDEVGRGAWAGPVSVGLALFRADAAPPEGLRDSKQVPEHRRELLFDPVAAWCTDWSVGHASPGECDRWGMTAALRLAARRAFATLDRQPQVVLMDGGFDYISDPAVPGSHAGGSPVVRTVVGGDARCVSIAAASILAKVTRDRAMRDLAPSFPVFDFERNKGYPSPAHRMALAGFGLTSIHRRSWSYVDDLAFR